MTILLEPLRFLASKRQLDGFELPLRFLRGFEVPGRAGYFVHGSWRLIDSVRPRPKKPARGNPQELSAAMDEHILEPAELMATYIRGAEQAA